MSCSSRGFFLVEFCAPYRSRTQSHRVPRSRTGLDFGNRKQQSRTDLRRFPDKVCGFLPIPEVTDRSGQRQPGSATCAVLSFSPSSAGGPVRSRAKSLAQPQRAVLSGEDRPFSSRERVRLKFVTRSPGVLASKSRATIYCKSVAFGDGLELCGSGSIGYYGNQHPGLLSPGGHASLQGWDVGRRGGAGRGSAQPAGETFPLS